MVEVDVDAGVACTKTVLEQFNGDLEEQETYILDRGKPMSLALHCRLEGMTARKAERRVVHASLVCPSRPTILLGSAVRIAAVQQILCRR